MSDTDERERTWDMRGEQQQLMLGTSNRRSRHAVVPFNLGGQADVLVFRNHVPGQVAATCELLGEPTQKQNSLGTFELVILNARAGVETVDDLPSGSVHLRTQGPGWATPWAPRHGQLSEAFDDGWPCCSPVTDAFEYAGSKAGLCSAFPSPRRKWKPVKLAKSRCSRP